ncbi:uncharacterized protein LOC114783374 isoform X1 [Denticeps clupeoides]|uniref:HAT C-terminal dimerisation domain-containing protein n=2 Tax=Denticeps clupeoides TaxID=299321 RepID=A0AAY4CQV1_9TELE|nr:uncharacterized protein LOC114783374 isoform X1 [Denticeps clupeoides]
MSREGLSAPGTRALNVAHWNRRSRRSPQVRPRWRSTGPGRPLSNQQLQLLRMMVTDLLPLSTVEHAGFQAFVQTLNPACDVQLSVKWVRDELFRIYEDTREKVQKDMNSVGHIVLSAELWPANQGQDNYVTVSGHFIDKYWKRRCCVLETLHLHGDQTPGCTVHHLRRLAAEWKIKDKVNVVVSNIRAMREACEGEGWTHIRCLALNLNMVFKEAMASADDPAWKALLRKCRNIVRFFSSDAEARHLLTSHQARLKLPTAGLMLSPDETLLSTFNMLHTISQQAEAINSVLMQQVKETLWLKKSEKATLSTTLSALQPFKDTIDQLSHRGFDSISSITPLVTDLQKKMGGLAQGGNKLAETLDHQIKKLFGDIKKNRWLTLSTFLDPRFKSAMLFSHKADEIKNKVIAEMQTLHKTEQDDVLCDVLANYVTSSSMEKQQNPLDYWRLPRDSRALSPVALKYLTTVSTAAPLERAFHQHTSLKIRSLEPQNVHLLLFLNTNWSTLP